MKSESIMFESNLGIKLFLDADIYKLKENMELAPSEPAIVSETLFAAPNSPTPDKPSAKLLVLVENADKTNKSAKETEFITKLVNAVGIHMKDVQIRSYADADSVESKKAILFLTSPEKAKGLALFESYNQELSKYSPFNVYNQQIIWGDGLDSIMESVDLKKSLWGSLKIMFGLA